MLRSRATLLALSMNSLLCPPGLGASPAESPKLEGTAWTLETLGGDPVPASRPPTLRFEAGRALGHDGCNQFAAGYTSEAQHSRSVCWARRP